MRRSFAAGWALLLGAALPGCGGKEDGGTAVGAAADGLPAPRGRPDGAGWDALSFVRSSNATAAEVEVFDLARVRAVVGAGGASAGEGAADVRRWLVRGLGLPEDAGGVALVFKEREEPHGRVVRMRAAKVATPLEGVRKAALSKGGVEGVVAGRPSWKMESASGGALTVWADGWLLAASPEHAEEIERALAARGGKDALRDFPGLSEAVADLPDSLPMQVEWGPKFGDFGAGLTPPRAAVIAISAEDPDTAVTALLFASDAERAAARVPFETLIAAAVKAEKVQPAKFGDRGRVLLLGMSGATRKGAFERRARRDLRTLRSLLRTWRFAHSGFPTTAEGLAALAKDPENLDEFLGVLPKDPWGHDYHYVSPHPKNPDEVDLRSAGPDGEIDTEDDVFPDE